MDEENAYQEPSEAPADGPPDEQDSASGEQQASDAGPSNEGEASAAMDDNTGADSSGSAIDDKESESEQQAKEKTAQDKASDALYGDQQQDEELTQEEDAGPAPPLFNNVDSANKNKIKIKNYDDYNINKLRCALTKEKFIEDPIAFMLNKTWQPDLNDLNDLIFDFELEKDVSTINLRTFQSIQKAINKALEDKDSFDLFPDDTIAALFADEIFSYMNKVSTNFSKIYKPGSPNVVERVVLFWISQIFQKNIEPTYVSNNKDVVVGINIANDTVFRNSYENFEAQNNPDGRGLIAVFFAFYYLTYYFLQARGKGQNYQNLFKDLPQNFAEWYDYWKNGQNFIEGSQELLSFKQDFSLNIKDLIITMLDAQNEYTNENNYYFKNSAFKSTIETSNYVNYLDSPLNNAKNLTKSEKSFIATAKQVQKCRETQKNETSFRAFYKEGNDNILDGKFPEDGLGCDKKTESWSQALNNFFDADNLLKTRVNYSIPYYFVNKIKTKNIIPKNLDLTDRPDKTTIKGKKILKDLSYRVLRLFALQENFTDNTFALYQNDKNFIDSLISKPSLGLWKDYYKMQGSYEAPLEGQYNELGRAFTSAIGALSVGHRVSRGFTKTFPPKPSANRQNFYFTNPSEKQNVGGVDNLIFFNDSQVNYGQQYSYDLNHVIAFNVFNYKYENYNKKLTKSIDSFSMSVDVNHVLSGYEESLSIEEVFATKSSSLLSFNDLPPRALILQIFPKRGNNQEIIMTFQNTSFDGIEKRIIDKKLWTEGWNESRKYYLQNQKIDPNTVDDNAVFFENRNIATVEVYFSKDKKPTSLLELNKIFTKVDVISEGLYALATIEPNTKYYFAIKSVSATGLQSYFSQVYEVELVDDGGTVFPLIKTIQFDEKEIRKDFIELTKKFRIEPALLQQAPNPSTDNIGYLIPQLWADTNETKPQFKIRLTSKKTGKKVDFNIIYKKNLLEEDTNNPNLELSLVKKDKFLISYDAAEKSD